ncbi:ADP-ribose pyrophosphatase YjhB, NUDIX family [Micromonospora haikouensis]|uniref:ADP-ribose pyrophosphatase YjhB, NUDIX family n=1 Tax=Micromonospora haikouensis TaxID=686309 RepID=A0A1C4V844_9ACTN|nr:NUDIX domain-containing protein [Micromonospora haikouensis]SCE79955.1 ADP-ribose pyrophosphatase YjhB, NUDIX family [Micromonospora haikouensis]
MIEIACVLLVDRGGRVLLQLRDGNAPRHPNVWALPGGHREPGETVDQTALRELREETGLGPASALRLYAVQDGLESDRVKHYFWAGTTARQEDVVLGEGAAMLFVAPDELIDGRPYTPGTAEVLARFLAAEEYAAARRSAGG